MRAKDRILFASRRFVTFTIAALIWVGALLGFYKIWPSMDAYLFPVLTDQQIVELSKDQNVLTFTIEATKSRSCRLASLAWSIVSEDKRQSIEVSNAGGENAIGRAYVPTGRTVLGPFTAQLPKVAPGPKARVEGLLLYDCNWGWLVEQILGPVPVDLPGPVQKTGDLGPYQPKFLAITSKGR